MSVGGGIRRRRQVCSGVKSASSGRNVRFLALLVCVILAVLFLFPARLWARPVGRQQAETAVRGWLKRNPRPMEMQLGASVRKIDAFEGEDGAAIYYVIYLDPSGFVIVPADDRIEPIVAFAEKGIYDPSPENHLGALVGHDLPARIAAMRNLEGAN